MKDRFFRSALALVVLGSRIADVEIDEIGVDASDGISRGDHLISGIFLVCDKVASMHKVIVRAAPFIVPHIPFGRARLVQADLPENDRGMIAVAADHLADVLIRAGAEGSRPEAPLPAGRAL